MLALDVGLACVSIAVIEHTGFGSVSSFAVTLTFTVTIALFDGVTTDGFTERDVMVGAVWSPGFDGDRRKIAGCPFNSPSPTICPDALMPLISESTHPESAGMTVFRSIAPLASVCRNACDAPSLFWRNQPALLPFAIASTLANIEDSPVSTATRCPGSKRNAWKPSGPLADPPMWPHSSLAQAWLMPVGPSNASASSTVVPSASARA